MHGISYRPTDLSSLEEFSKKSFLKIFIILFEQDCPEAVVHSLLNFNVLMYLNFDVHLLLWQGTLFCRLIGISSKKSCLKQW